MAAAQELHQLSFRLCDSCRGSLRGWKSDSEYGHAASSNGNHLHRLLLGAVTEEHSQLALSENSKHLDLTFCSVTGDISPVHR